MEEGGKTKEKTRVLAHSRRQKENDTFTDIAESLPIQENAKDLDKASILRVAIHYLKLRDLIQDGDELLAQSEHILDEDDGEAASSTPSPAEEHTPTIADFLPNYSRDVLQALDGFLLVVSRDGRVLFVSESITNYLGLRQVDVIGVHVQDIIHPQDCSEIVTIFQTQGRDRHQVFDSKNPLRRNFVVRMRCAFTPSVRAITRCSNFKPIYCSCYLKFAKNGAATGQFLGLVALCRMASTSRIKEMCVGTSFKTKHNLDLSYAAVDTRIRWILGYDPSELMGLKAYQYFHPQDLSATSSCHMNLLSRGRSHSPCYRFMSRWGDWVWVRSDSHMLFNPVNHLPDGIVIYTWIVRIDEEDDRMKAIADGGDGEKERMQYDSFENSLVAGDGKLDLKSLADPGIKPDPLTPPSVAGSAESSPPVQPVEQDSGPSPTPSHPSPLQPLTLPPLPITKTTPTSSASVLASGSSPQATSSVFQSPDSVTGDFPPNVNPFPMKQARQSCAIGRSAPPSSSSSSPSSCSSLSVLSPPDQQSSSTSQVAEVIDQSAFSDSHHPQQSFMSPPYTPYSQTPIKHTSFEAPLSFETNSPYANFPTPAYTSQVSPPDAAPLRQSVSPSELSPDGCRYGSVSPPHSLSPHLFSTEPYKLQENLQITSQATEFLVEADPHLCTSQASNGGVGFQDPNMEELSFLNVGMGQPQEQQQQQQQNGNRPSVLLEGSSYVNQARMQYAGTAPGSQVKGHVTRRKNNREATEISQWSQWLKGSAPAPVY